MPVRTNRLPRGVQLAVLVVLVFLPVACSQQDSPTGPHMVSNPSAPPATAPTADAEVQSFINMVNSHRTSMGLAPLVWDSRVAAVAQANSQDMVNRHYYGHINPDGLGPDDRLDAAGIGYSWWGENYCYGFSTASAAYNFWINSAPHRANIENGNFTHHGVGKVGSVWTHMFIRPTGVTTGVENP